MKKIEVTLEVTKRLSREFDIPDRAFELLNDAWKIREVLGEKRWSAFLIETATSSVADIDTDYSVNLLNDDGEYVKTIIDWN